MKLVLTTFVAYFALSAAWADTLTFSENEARPVLTQSIQNESAGKIVLSNFRKTDGQKSVEAGISFYELDFTAEIEFEKTGVWFKGLPLPGGRIGFGMGEAGTGWAAFNNQIQGGIGVHRGDHATLSGAMIGQRTENGWKIEVRDSEFVSMRSGTPTERALPASHEADPPVTLPIVPHSAILPQSAKTDSPSGLGRAAAHIFDKILKSESEREIKRIPKTSNQHRVEKIDAEDAERYWVNYDTKLEFETDGIWVDRTVSPKHELFHFASLPLSDTEKPHGLEFHKGDQVTITGTLIAEKSDTGWRATVRDAFVLETKRKAQVDLDAATICIKNLGLIDKAKQEWALQFQKTTTETPTEADLLPFLGLGTQARFPTCPAGGTYTINAIEKAPVCSNPEHYLP